MRDDELHTCSGQYSTCCAPDLLAHVRHVNTVGQEATQFAHCGASVLRPLELVRILDGHTCQRSNGLHQMYILLCNADPRDEMRYGQLGSEAQPHL